MIALIEWLIGSKFGRAVAEIAMGLMVLGLAFAMIAHHERGIELAKLQKSSTALLAKANTDIKRETDQHAADVKANEAKTDAALTAAHNLSDALDSSVRNFDAYRRAHPDVSRTSGGPSAAQSGECGALSCGDLASSALQDGNELARSVGELSATLQSCQRDRDSLTGLPK